MIEVFRFECRYQLRSPLFWSMAVLFFLLAFFAMASEDVRVGGVGSNVNLNGSFAIIQTQYVFSILMMFAGIAFVAGAITRDYETRTAELLFASGVRERDYYFGRFAGGLLFCTLVFCAALLGTLVGSSMPWLDPQRLGEFSAAPYVYSLMVVILPNALIISCLFFVVAALSRSMLAAYMAALAFLVFFVVLSSLADPEQIKRFAVLDPFGIAPFGEQTRYWTTFERNEVVPVIEGSVLQGRILWTSLALLVLMIGSSRFRFALGSSRRIWWRRKAPTSKPNGELQPTELPVPGALAEIQAAPQQGFWVSLAQFRSQLYMDVRGILRSVPFYVLLAFGLFNTVGSILGSIELAYGTPVYPSTRLMITAASGAFSLVLLMVLIYYAGELVHREQQTRLKQIVDATPYPSGIMVAAKALALWFVLLMMLFIITLTAVVIQLLHGYSQLELGLYVRGLFGAFGMDFFLLAVLSVVVQVLSPNKFLGMLVVLLIFISLRFLPDLGFEHYLYRFEVPSAPYSDMNGFGHYAKPVIALSGYWLLWCGLLVACAHLLFTRGVTVPLRQRLVQARNRLTPKFVGGVALLAMSTGLAGGYVFYNTNVLNEYVLEMDLEERNAEYEKTYGYLKHRPVLELVSLDTEVDLYPLERRLQSRGRAQLLNRSPESMAELLFSLSPDLEVGTLSIDDQALTLLDATQNVWLYCPPVPLATGAMVALAWDLDWSNPGFPNSAPTDRIVANGTFVDSTEIMPLPGYDSGRELQDNNVRREYDLPNVERLPKLDDAFWLGRSMFGLAQRTDFRAVISTASDQIATAPGYLQREWQEGGRRYFEYAMDAPIWPFVSYTSARYAVEREVHDGLALEVYYHPPHHWNVSTMLKASRDSLAYFSEAFSPYQYRQFRILEFPGYQSFAQSFPNTIPYSESIGFMADLSDEQDLDFVYYVTAHEAAHQWWGHQLAGARVQGVSALSETLSQYSALMVMERQYGEPMMRRFLKRELDRYLIGRGSELIEELPVALVENQPYIHYRKGSLVMYDLKQMLGEDAVNRALRRMLKRFAFTGPPFPTTIDLISEFKREANPAQRQRIVDLFEKITLYELAVTEANVRPVGERFEVTLTVQAAKFYADGEGRETEAPFSETILVGVFPEDSEDLATEDLPPPLYLKPHQVNSGTQTLTITVDERPDQVGVDPYVYRVDRNPDNNLKRL
ncbi:MAG: ABC transporter permease subunit [Pseudomonadales bacterium]